MKRSKIQVLEDLHELEDAEEIKSGFIKNGENKYIRVFWLGWYDAPEGVLKEKKD